MNEQKTNQLFVFRKIVEEDDVQFNLQNRIILKDMPEFKNVCMDFQFVNQKGLERDTLIFCKKD